MQPSMLDESEHGKKKEEDEIVEESPKIENSQYETDIVDESMI